MFRPSSILQRAGGRIWRSLLVWGILLLASAAHPARAESTNAPAKMPAIGLASPPVMTATFYELGSDRKKALFKYRRAATQTGDVVHVEQTFSLPDGALVCRENIRYRQNQLVSYFMEDLRANIRGSILLEPNPKKSGGTLVLMDFIDRHDGNPKFKKASETLQTNTLISDMIYPYIRSHWDELMKGSAVKFHIISLDPATTFTFRLNRESETNWAGRAVERVKMEASNLIVGHWLKPMYFIIEKDPPHRALSYIGLATPRTLVDRSWKPVEAEAVFEWH